MADRSERGRSLFREAAHARALITILLAECELELMPPELARQPRVIARGRKRRRPPQQLLLDQAVDHEAMRGLEGADRRGRPDIAHFLALLAQDSLLQKRGALRLLFHTRNDELVRVRADTRLPRSQAKFYQLVEDLFRQGRVPLDDPLLTVEPKRALVDVLAAEGRGVKVLLDESGEIARGPDFTALARENEDATIVIGGFPRGGYRSAPRDAFDLVLRVADEPLSAWSAFVPVLAGLEDAFL